MTEFNTVRRQLLTYLGAVGLSEALCRQAFAAEHVLVANKSVRDTELSLEEVRRILSLRQTQWKDGSAIVLVLPPRHSGPMLWLTEELLQMPETTYQRLILGQVFRGAARQPIQTDSVAMTAQVVAARPFSLSALPRGALSDNMHAIVVLDSR